MTAGGRHTQMMQSLWMTVSPRFRSERAALSQFFTLRPGLMMAHEILSESWNGPTRWGVVIFLVLSIKVSAVELSRYTCTHST